MFLTPFARTVPTTIIINAHNTRMPGVKLAMEEHQGHWFSAATTSMLESYYNRGLTGWGSKHNDLFEEAIKATGLNESQLKMVIKFQKTL